MIVLNPAVRSVAVRAVLAQLQLSGVKPPPNRPRRINQLQCPACSKVHPWAFVAAITLLAGSGAVNGSPLYYCYVRVPPVQEPGGCTGWRGLAWYMHGHVSPDTLYLTVPFESAPSYMKQLEDIP